ncbi:MAG: electron transfer flavoprotein subunit alpha/FixB family protein [Pirellulales bacterium]|nr:electron transfer flavoprotein subunit alpha/FixB family protein [Pirellulales bacterium]
MSTPNILVLAETHDNTPADITLELLGGARQLAAATGGQVVAIVLGQAGSAAAEKMVGADRVVVIEDATLDAYSPGPYLAVLEHILTLESPRAVLIGSTTVGLDVGPALGAKLDAPVVGNCLRIEKQDDMLSVTSSLCGGKILADVEVRRGPAILMVLPGSFHATDQPATPEVDRRASPVPLEPGRITFDQMILPEAGDVDITAQDILVGVGRGIQQEDNMEVAEELAEALGGALCASRPIVDQGWLPTTRQVGKSGMTVKPKLYLALGISGAPEHLEGMKGTGLVIAVNTDPNAPIFDVAQYGTELDLLDLAPELTEAIKTRRVAT